MPYSLSFVFLLLYLLMCHLLPLSANTTQWDLILEPIASNKTEHTLSTKVETKVSSEPIVLERLKDILQQKYHLGGEIILTPLVHWNIFIHEKDWSLELINAPNKLTATTTFNIRIMQNGKVLAANKNWVLQIENLVTCLCAKHNLASNTAVDFQAFKTEKRNLLNPSKQPFPIDMKGSFHLKHRLCAGDILFEDTIEQQALVHKGNCVDVFLKKGYLALTLKGIALDNGNLNEIILVKNTSTNKTFRGKIVDANTIQVAF